MAKRLVRTVQDKKLGGVCGGFGSYLGVDPVLLRVGLIAVTLFTGIFPGLVFYAGAWLVMPEETGSDEETFGSTRTEA